MSCYIQHIATAVPPGSLSLTESMQHLSEFVPDPRMLQRVLRILTATGIRKRHLAALEVQLNRPAEARLYPPLTLAPNGPTTEQRLAHVDRLAAPLMDQLLSQIPNTQWANIERLVTVTCTMAGSPGLERWVLRDRPIPRSVDRWHLGFMGCSASLAGLRLLRALHSSALNISSISAGMVVALELSSLHVQYTDRIDQMVANALFADGASAIVVSSQPSPWRVVDCRCVTLDAAADQMIWQVGNHGFTLNLAVELPDTLGSCISGAVNELLNANNLSMNQVQHWAIHPGGPKIVDAVCQALALSHESGDASRAILAEFGNMSSATIGFILRRMMQAKLNGYIVAMAFGPGLTIELALFEAQSDS